MKPTKTLKRLSALAFMCLLIVVACSKDDSSGGGSNKPLTEFEFSGIFTGTLNNNGAVSDLEGYVTIDDDGATRLNLLTGSMKGSSVKTGPNYNITVTEANGAFAGIEDITGTIDTATRTIYLSGTNPDGSQMTVGGNAANPNLVTDGGWGSLQKSAVVFTHNETCKATVTINGVSFSGLNGFYQEGGLCSDYYFQSNQIRFNMDSKSSEIFCHDITLLGLDGQMHTYTDCNTIRFVLNKNTQYTYTVAWENGETGSGTFTTPDGGFQLPICLSNDGAECDGEGGLEGQNGNPRFNLQFSNAGNVDLDLYVQTPNGSIIYYGNETAQGGTIDVDCACGNACDSENIFFNNGPSGQYTFWVDYYGDCGSGSTSSNFTVKVMDNNTVVQTKTGTLNSGESTHWTYNHN
ncbi:hypothetical protein HYN59_03490 [Flavobacterium album]|uniref:Uncharacterized protein n=1 Tax=Flavobacterium album TaxID=2175091 RepID=A0A2S1QVI9_9FLAO|nr:hypothetical protein [Flavobacterium album]AWH84231.1 hypothetical protein HYN59_03490 [Flavobacterium album]